LLEPLLDDPSHDVRVAMLPALAAAYAKTNTPEKVADILTSSETHAMRRLVAAAAAIGLVERDATLSVQLLEPLLDDPSHDVRVAMLPALAAAYAKTNTPEKVSDLLTDSETQSMRRLVAAGAFVMLARTDNGRPASETALKKIDGPPMAHATAKLVEGLIAGKADGIAFLQELVP
jgi:hypothetical protein